MGIYEEWRKTNKKNILIVMEIKKFEDIGYWLRDIKKKFRNFEILRMKITLNVDYYDGDEMK